MHILNKVIFQASITKDCEAEEISMQKKRLESTLRICHEIYIPTRSLTHSESGFGCFFLDATAQCTLYVNWQLYHLPDPLCIDEQK